MSYNQIHTSCSGITPIPMLKSVHIHDYRSCKNVVLDNIESMLVLIGRNGAGKTTVMQAINWAARVALNEEHLMPSVWKGDGHIRLVFEIGSKEYQYQLEKRMNVVLKENKHQTQIVFVETLAAKYGNLNFQIFERNNETVLIHRNDSSGVLASKINISNSSSSLLALKSILPDDDGVLQELNLVSAFLASIKYYPLQEALASESITDSMIGEEAYHNWVATNFNEGESDAPDLILFKLIFLYLEQKQTFDEICQLLGANGLGLIDLIEITLFGATPNGFQVYFVSFVSFVNKSAGRLSQLSFGTRRILNLIVSMFFDHASISMIEQPEDGIHSGLLKKLIPLLRAYSENKQFIFASHSTAIFNNMQPEEVRIVEINNGVTEVKPLNAVELNAASKYLEQDGSFSDFLELI